MKFLGFLLIIGSSALLGMNYSAEKKARINDLQAFISMLEILCAELNNRLYPLPELFENISSKLEGRAASFANLLKLNMYVLGEKNFETIWYESYFVSGAALSDKENNEILSLGKTLGRYDLETQLAAIEACILSLKECEKMESFEFPKLRQLSLGVSLSAGMLLAIFLV